MIAARRMMRLLHRRQDQELLAAIGRHLRHVWY
jgi:hypothetical protein